MQRTQKQDIYTRITNQMSATWKKASGLGFGRGMPNMPQDELPAHSATMGGTGFGANGQDFLKLSSAADVVCAKLNGHVLIRSDSLA